MILWLLGVGAEAAEFVSALRSLPCQDGWMACLVGAERVDPGFREDTRGRPVLGDARIAWFDLAATPVFSPFVGLSAYPVPPPRPPPPPRGGPAQVPVEVPVVDTVDTVDARVEVVDVVDPGVGCGEGLEERAVAGQLGARDVGCLEARISAGTEEALASSLLLADAWARRDRAWPSLARRHLEAIDPADAEVAYRLAVRAATEPEGAAEAYRWAGAALDHRYLWTGQRYDDRVMSLYKVRAAAAQDLWRAEGSDEARERTRTAAREWLDFARAKELDASVPEAVCLAAADSPAWCR
jgi:hypothetical protein